MGGLRFPKAEMSESTYDKPDAGNPHARFDERERETEPLAQRLNATAPFLDSTTPK